VVVILHEAHCTTVAEAAKKHKVSGPTIYALHKHFGGQNVADVKRLRALELENNRPKRLLAERALRPLHNFPMRGASVCGAIQAWTASS
jgi:putative transposase